MKYQAIMFDLDGTLLDTLDDLADAMNATLAENGYPVHQYPFYRTAVGDGAGKLVERSLPPEHRTPDVVEAARQRMREHYANCWNVKTHPYDGISELIQQLASLPIPIAVLSNKPEPATLECTHFFFPADPFTIVRGAREQVPLKPDPTAALDIARELNIPAQSWLYVGDTNTDMQTAVRAGFCAVGVTWGFRDRAELEANGAHHIIDHPAELLRLIPIPRHFRSEMK